MADVLGIMGAMEPEVSAVRAALVDVRVTHHLGYDLHEGLLDGARVVVMRGGVGKVNAALATTAIAAAGIDRLLFVGVAGGLAATVHVGDLVIATDLVQHDVDVTAMGLEPGRLLGEPASWESDEEFATLVADAAGRLGVTVHRGRIASGDQFIASADAATRIRTTFDAVATEMEGAAVAQAASRLALPFAVTRWISDSADEGAVTDFPAFLTQAAERDAAIVREVLTALTER